MVSHGRVVTAQGYTPDPMHCQAFPGETLIVHLHSFGLRQKSDVIGQAKKAGYLSLPHLKKQSELWHSILVIDLSDEGEFVGARDHILLDNT